MDEKLIESIKQQESITTKIGMAMIFLCSSTVIVYIILMYQDIHQIYIDVHTASTLINSYTEKNFDIDIEKMREDLSEISTCVLQKYCKRVPD